LYLDLVFLYMDYYSPLTWEKAQVEGRCTPRTASTLVVGPNQTTHNHHSPHSSFAVA
jgi:hypothetical protein